MFKNDFRWISVDMPNKIVSGRQAQYLDVQRTTIRVQLGAHIDIYSMIVLNWLVFKYSHFLVRTIKNIDWSKSKLREKFIEKGYQPI